MAKKSKKSKGKKNKKKMTKIPEKVIVFGVNDPLTRIGLTLLAFLCIFGAVGAFNAMKIEGYKYLGMVLVSLYVIQVINSMFAEVPSPVYRAHRGVRTIVPLILFTLIYFIIFNFQTLAVSVLVLSTVFGILAFVLLVFPIDGFHFLYVLLILILGCMLSVFAFDHDPKVQPFWFCFLVLFVYGMAIYFFNYPGPTNRAFSFY